MPSKLIPTRIRNGTHSDDGHEPHKQSCSFQYDKTKNIKLILLLVAEKLFLVKKVVIAHISNG
ncbi:hypothetical protein RO3G_16924 [Rhizopus delemar RA 99-880]|uniref:Uncharacterized protein n=1 Tax=Rhizopus delemar (strain RA 99-880 / ATCC MYA-4621 / FGSC 9543 / NRRL 43880) TaxID=246409 RepID=I1CVC2_RHIO9|nr:hypothetical protein RO3G_16924 [Rhizopus delemar RA 99-880]|eukprot:EIE92402.1 hypothetical protein RO3G_16924 [Rhizopus delemar RA 99-880]